MKKGGLAVALTITTILNYALWALVLKPIGINESLMRANSSLTKGMGNPKIELEWAELADSQARTYAIAKTLVYLLTTGVFILVLLRKNSYKNISMGTAVLAASCLALLVDFLNMTLLPAFVFYILAFVLIISSKDLEPSSQPSIPTTSPN